MAFSRSKHLARHIRSTVLSLHYSLLEALAVLHHLRLPRCCRSCPSSNRALPPTTTTRVAVDPFSHPVPSRKNAPKGSMFSVPHTGHVPSSPVHKLEPSPGPPPRVASTCTSPLAPFASRGTTHCTHSRPPGARPAMAVHPLLSAHTSTADSQTGYDPTTVRNTLPSAHTSTANSQTGYNPTTVMNTLGPAITPSYGGSSSAERAYVYSRFSNGIQPHNSDEHSLGPAITPQLRGKCRHELRQPERDGHAHPHAFPIIDGLVERRSDDSDVELHRRTSQAYWPDEQNLWSDDAPRDAAVRNCSSPCPYLLLMSLVFDCRLVSAL